MKGEGVDDAAYTVDDERTSYPNSIYAPLRNGPSTLSASLCRSSKHR